MENLKWLWDYLRDLYKPPETYICRGEYFRWMCYTASFVEELAGYVTKTRTTLGVERSILYFQKTVSKFNDQEMAKAGHAVSQAAIETYRAAVYK